MTSSGLPNTADVIVVGGGTAGCVVASRLAACGVDTVLIEAGPSDWGRPEVLEVRRWQDLLGGELDWDYTIAPQLQGNSAIRHSRARVLGGCSSHNSCIAFVPPDSDFVAWEELGATGWGPTDVAGAFDAVRSQVPRRRIPADNPVNAAVLAACAEAGLPEVRFGDGEWFRDGADMFTVNVVDGVRQSASVAYLHTPGVPDALTICTNTPVLGLLMEGTRCRGVRTATTEIHADTVVLAGGAFASPQLLALAGIGPAGDLRSLGIDVVCDLPGVGANLQDHPEGVIVFATNEPVPAPVVQGWEVGIFAEDTGDGSGPELMFHLGLECFDAHTTALGYPTATHGVSLTPNVCRPASRGSVRLRSRHPGDVPNIDFGYFTDPGGHDEAVLVAGVDWARRIMSQPSVAGFIDRELAPGVGVVDPDDVGEYVRRTANTVYHPVGTCRMGSDPVVSPDGTAGAVVDCDLAVHGTEGLYVADASVFPMIPSVNPALTVMMVGERCASLLLTKR